MKQRFTYVLLGVLIVASVVNIIKTNQLSEQLNSINSTTSWNNHEALTKFNSLENTIRSELQQAQSILTSHETTYAYENAQLVCTVTATPKVYSPQSTAFLVIGNDSVEMTAENGVFTGQLTTALNINELTPMIRLQTGDTFAQQMLDTVYPVDALTLYPLTIFVDHMTGEPQEGTPILICYDSGFVSDSASMEAAKISLTMQDRITGDIVDTIPIEKANDAMYQYAEDYEGAFSHIYYADLEDRVGMVGDYVVMCDMTTQSGLRYYFEVANMQFDSTGSGGYGSSGMYVQPIFY